MEEIINNKKKIMEDQQKRDDHDLLIKIDTKLEMFINQVSLYKKELDELEKRKCDKDLVSDLEKRMRRMERIIYIGLGGLAVLQFAIQQFL